MSNFSKYGDSGYGRFLAGWLKSFMARQSKEFQKDMHRLFKGQYKDSIKLLAHFVRFKRDFGDFLEIVKGCNGLTDFERLEAALVHIGEELDIECYFDISNEKVNSLIKSQNMVICISSENLATLDKGCIKENITFPVLLQLGDKFDDSEMARLAFIYRGFTLHKMQYQNGHYVLHLLASAHNEYVISLGGGL